MQLAVQQAFDARRRSVTRGPPAEDTEEEGGFAVPARGRHRLRHRRPHRPGRVAVHPHRPGRRPPRHHHRRDGRRHRRRHLRGGGGAGTGDGVGVSGLAPGGVPAGRGPVHGGAGPEDLDSAASTSIPGPGVVPGCGATSPWPSPSPSPIPAPSSASPGCSRRWVRRSSRRLAGSSGLLVAGGCSSAWCCGGWCWWCWRRRRTHFTPARMRLFNHLSGALLLLLAGAGRPSR